MTPLADSVNVDGGLIILILIIVILVGLALFIFRRV